MSVRLHLSWRESLLPEPHLTAVRVRAAVAVRHRRVVIGM